MGNSNTKESRTEGEGSRRPSLVDSGAGRGSSTRSGRRSSRADLGLFGLGHGSSSRDRDRADAPFERRETKQEREARRLERERVARAKERERSMREEHVDGGYLVTLGTYTGTEDFSKPVVRQLQIERKMAPFWRGLNDWSSSWAEHQLIAAARGLPIPPADAPPDPELVSRPPRPDAQSSVSQNIQNLTVPMGDRTLSAGSDRSGSGVSSPVSPGPRNNSPFKPKGRALAAALSIGSRNASSTDLAPKETALPHDPFVNGQALEVFLYKDADECPICFLTYPPYLNHTRCCDQPICSECFVQIKRADPHLPEHHPDGEARDPNEGLNPEDPPEMLISEPSACPYCQQPEFGVTYDPPPFRRGLTYSSYSTHPTGSTAMSSQSSLNSTLPTSPSQPGRRRTHSLSANAPNVITTDRVRPDWATKLASARAHQARRAAAATALHTAAFLMGGSEQRSILRPGRFSRRNTGNTNNNNSVSTPNEGQATPANEQNEGPEAGARGSSRSQRRNRMDELEEMMFMEAIRLSLAAEEERKRKEEKALRKEAKKREKEERKALKKQGGSPYGGGTSGASGSSLSLGLGRRRGNSTASNLRMEATVQGASQAAKSSEQFTEPPKPKEENNADKGKGVDRGQHEVSSTQPGSSSSSLPIPSGPSRGASHLRQMSNASSIGSSLGDSPSGSYTGQGYLGPDGNNPRSSGLSLGAYSDDGDRDTGSAGSEPMFNFSSLAQMVGANLEDGSPMVEYDRSESPGNTIIHPRPLSQVREEDKEEPEAEHVEEGGTEEPRNNTRLNTKNLTPDVTTPELMITPETPAPTDNNGLEDKQLGHSDIRERTTHYTQ